jgi:hypothetical protein
MGFGFLFEVASCGRVKSSTGFADNGHFFLAVAEPPSSRIAVWLERTFLAPPKLAFRQGRVAFSRVE